MVKILAFVDMHGDLSALIKLKKKAKKADLIVCAGDLTLFESDIDYFLYEMNKLGKPVLMLHGNHEASSTLRNMCKPLENLTFIHKKLHKFKDILFIGYGGGGFSLREPDFEKFVKKNKAKIKGRIILVSHAPPFGTKLDKINSGHYGNKSITKFIEQFKPKLVICGHFHESAGIVQKIGKTLAINPGPSGKVIEI